MRDSLGMIIIGSSDWRFSVSGLFHKHGQELVLAKYDFRLDRYRCPRCNKTITTAAACLRGG